MVYLRYVSVHLAVVDIPTVDKTEIVDHSQYYWIEKTAIRKRKLFISNLSGPAMGPPFLVKPTTPRSYTTVLGVVGISPKLTKICKNLQKFLHTCRIIVNGVH